MTRVAFAVEGNGAAWVGGVNYLRNLLQAVTALPARRIEPVLLVSSKADLAPFSAVPALEVIRTPLLDRPITALRKGLAELVRRDLLLDRLLVSRGIEVLSHSGHLGRKPASAVVSWIPDFQHRALPHFFSRRERLTRDYLYRCFLRHATTVVVSSESAARDLDAFAPGHRSKVRVLRFATLPSEQGNGTTLQDLEQRHRFTGPYFHLPNQFWAHKNHRVVVDALRLLKSRGQSPLVLATGSPHDYRNPNFFPSFCRRLAEAGVEGSFRILGLVSYPDLVALMRHSLAVINPSHFEGWSTSVEEAKSLGQRVLLSSIPVHREQAPARGEYFDPDSPAELAGLMERIWAARDEQVGPCELDGAARARFRAFGETFEEILLQAAEQRRRTGGD